MLKKSVQYSAVDRRLSPALIAWTLAGILFLSIQPAAGWTPQTRVQMADYALRVTPPHLVGQIERHQKRFHEGILAAAKSDPTVDSQGMPIPVEIDLDRLIETEVEQAIRAIVDHQPFSQIVYQLGVVAYWVASVNNPLLSTEAGKPGPPYWQDYFQYLQDASHRFSVLYYGHDRQFDTPAALAALLAQSQSRSLAMAPWVAEEYRRVGSIDGAELFDDRSTAFGVGALAFSHGVSDIAGVLRYIWLRAGGVDSRRLPPLDKDHLILVERGRQRP